MLSSLAINVGKLHKLRYWISDGIWGSYKLKRENAVKGAFISWGLTIILSLKRIG